MAEEIRQRVRADRGGRLRALRRWLTELYGAEMAQFIERNFDSPLDLVRPLPPALRLLRLGAFRRLDSAVARYFDDERLQRLFSFQALYAGLAPHQALAVYAVITYMDAINGVVVTDGGVHAVPMAMAAAAERGGVSSATAATSSGSRPPADGGRVTGVRLAGGELVAADVVVCNADMPEAYRSLLPGSATAAARSPRQLLTVGRGVARRRPGCAA